MPHHQTASASRTTVQSDVLTRIASLPRFRPNSLEELKTWLKSHGVNDETANSKKGLNDLLAKVSSGEAELVYDPESTQVYRLARVVRIDATMTINGQRVKSI